MKRGDFDLSSKKIPKSDEITRFFISGTVNEKNNKNSQLSQNYEQILSKITKEQLLEKCIQLFNERKELLKRVRLLAEKNADLQEQIACLRSSSAEILKLKKFVEQQKRPKQKIPLDMAVVLDLKQKGYSNVRIAKLMGVSESTIRNRLSEIPDDDELL